MTTATDTSRRRRRTSRAGSSGRSGSCTGPCIGSPGGQFGLRPATNSQWGMLRLRTVGRQTGRSAVAIVGYIEDGPNLVTPAMNGWAEPEPAWWLNLQAHPEATVELLDGSRAVTRPRRGRRGAGASVAALPRPRFLRVQRCQRRSPINRDRAGDPGAASRRVGPSRGRRAPERLDLDRLGDTGPSTDAAATAGRGSLACRRCINAPPSAANARQLIASGGHRRHCLRHGEEAGLSGGVHRHGVPVRSPETRAGCQWRDRARAAR